MLLLIRERKKQQHLGNKGIEDRDKQVLNGSESESDSSDDSLFLAAFQKKLPSATKSDLSEQVRTRDRTETTEMSASKVHRAVEWNF